MQATATSDEKSDLMLGSAQGDELSCGGGDDILLGRAGNDKLDGGTGNDVLYGSLGDDLLAGGSGFDTYIYYTGDGNDTISEMRESDGSIEGRIIIDRESQNLTTSGLFTKSGEQEVWKAADGSQITLTKDSEWKINLLDGATIDLGAEIQDGDYSIHLFEEKSPDTNFDRTVLGDLEPIDFDPNKDGVQEAYDDLGNAIVNPDQAAAGRNDYLRDGAGNDLIKGLAGEDLIYALRGGDDRLEGGDGADWIQDLGGNDIIVGGSGQDRLLGYAGTDSIYAGDQVTLSDAITADLLPASGQKGDWLDGGGEEDTLIGEAGNDAVMGGADGDILVGAAGDDDLWGDQAAVAVHYAWTVTRSVTQADGTTSYSTWYDGVEFFDGIAGGDDVLYGGGGEDWLHGESGNDVLDGGDDNDVLFGDHASDDLFGGGGDDILVGDNANLAQTEHGSDYLDGGAGADRLSGMGGDDTLFGDAGDDKLYGGEGADYLDGESGADTVAGQDGDDTLFGGGEADLLIGGQGADQISGEDGDDLIAGDEGGEDLSGDADTIDGGAGNDLIDAQGGDDTAAGGEGNDIISGRMGNDVLQGDAGNDQLQGGEGDDSLDGGSDSDVLFGEAGNDILVGGDGNDYLLGGLGDDTLDGGEGNDVYYYTTGEGNDHIADSGGTDWLVFTDAVWGQIALGVGSLKLTLPDGSAVHLDDFDPDNPLAGAIEYFQFADGSVKTRQQLIQALGFKIEGTPGDDVLSGTAWGEPIHAYAGNDMVTARAGDDSIDLGEGDDFADAGDGNDSVQAGDGNDLVLGGNGADQVDGGAGSDLLFGDAGNDQLGGGLGDDLLAGGAGNDKLLGGEGNDTYRFGVGAGIDVVTDSLGANAIHLEGGLTPEQVVFRRQGDDLLVSVPGTTDELTAQAWFAATSSGWTVGFDDGTLLDQAGVAARLQQNQAPVLGADAVAVAEDGVVQANGNALANDSDPEGRALRVSNPGTYGGTYGALSLATDGSFVYQLNNGAPAVQSLAAGQVVSDSFAYTATDDDPAGAMQSTAAIVVSVTGANDAPVVHGDTAAVAEDGPLVVSGNVLANDFDIDAGTTLRVAAPGSTSTTYGTLTLAADGAYTYTLNDGAVAVQALGRDQQATEQFAYAASDGLASVASSLAVTVTGRNDAPLLSAPLADQLATPNKAWAWQLPANSFTDIDQGDALAYTAILADGSPLPSWLTFDAATLTFSGRVPRTVTGFLDIQVTATDRVAATGSTVGSLSTSDVFRLDFGSGTGGGGGGGGGGSGGSGSQGNEGVGNGVDAPPPGHDVSFNDGPGTAPGEPGAAGGDGLGHDEAIALPPPRGAAPTKHEVFVSPPDLADVAAAAPSHGRRLGTGASVAAQPADGGDAAHAALALPTDASATGAAGITPSNGGTESAAAADPAAAGVTALLADWGSPQALPAYLNAQHWQDAAATWASTSRATSNVASVFADWLATDLALAEALAGRSSGAWLDGGNSADLSALSGLRGGYLGSRLAFREDAFSLLAGSGQSLKTFNGLGQGAQKIA